MQGGKRRLSSEARGRDVAGGHVPKRLLSGQRHVSQPLVVLHSEGCLQDFVPYPTNGKVGLMASNEAGRGRKRRRKCCILHYWWGDARGAALAKKRGHAAGSDPGSLTSTAHVQRNTQAPFNDQSGNASLKGGSADLPTSNTTAGCHWPLVAGAVLLRAVMVPVVSDPQGGQYKE